MKLKLLRDMVVILEADVISYEDKGKGFMDIFIPYPTNGQYDSAKGLNNEELLRIKLETEIKNYDGHGRFLCDYSYSEGILIRFKFDQNEDIH